MDELLKQDKFKFNTEEKIQIDRRHEPFPKDLDEAKLLWRQHIRYEYLQEKLGREISETNGQFTIKLPADAHTNIIATLQKNIESLGFLLDKEVIDGLLRMSPIQVFRTRYTTPQERYASRKTWNSFLSRC